MVKRFTSIISIFFLIFMLTGCNNSSDGNSLIKENVGKNKKISTAKKYNIALVMKTLTNPFFIDMEKGARKAERRFKVNLTVRTGAKETSIEQQIQIVDDLITKKVDAIVIAPGSSTELVPVLKRAQAKGIKIVNIDNRLDQKSCKKIGLTAVPFISGDNEKGAYLSAMEISKRIKTPTKAIILEGITQAENSNARVSGAEKAFKENSNITLVAIKSAHWKIDEAYQVTKDLLKKYTGIGAIFCANDMMALGSIQYIKEAKKNNILVSGYDDLLDARKAIREGYMISTINQQADIQGYRGIELAVRLLKSQKVSNEEYVKVKLITKDSISK